MLPGFPVGGAYPVGDGRPQGLALFCENTCELERIGAHLGEIQKASSKLNLRNLRMQ